MTTTTTTATEPFPFPPHHSFPPFYTLQPTLSTRHSQLTSWSSLIQAYCRHYRLFQLSLRDAVDSPLFHNRTLNRKLSIADAREVIEWMAGKEGEGRAEWVAVGGGKKGGGKGEEKDRFWVWWRKPEEWAGVVAGWVEATGQRGTVLTLYELTESDATAQQGMVVLAPGAREAEVGGTRRVR